MFNPCDCLYAAQSRLEGLRREAEIHRLCPRSKTSLRSRPALMLLNWAMALDAHALEGRASSRMVGLHRPPG